MQRTYLLSLFLHYVACITIRKNIRTIPGDAHPRGVLVMASEHASVRSIQGKGSGGPVTLQACCGTKCREFRDPLQMIGLGCCGEQILNDSESICCDGQIHPRKHGSNYYTDCCGQSPIAFGETCCDETIHRGLNIACCGRDAYDYAATDFLCCNDTLVRVPNNFVRPQCCGTDAFDALGREAICCEDKLHRAGEFNACCKSEGYHTHEDICCGTIYERSYYDSCCYVFEDGRNDPTPLPFRSDIQCCDIEGVKNLNSLKQCPVFRDRGYLWYEG